MVWHYFKHWSTGARSLWVPGTWLGSGCTNIIVPVMATRWHALFLFPTLSKDRRLRNCLHPSITHLHILSKSSLFGLSWPTDVQGFGHLTGGPMRGWAVLTTHGHSHMAYYMATHSVPCSPHGHSLCSCTHHTWPLTQQLCSPHMATHSAAVKDWN